MTPLTPGKSRTSVQMTMFFMDVSCRTGTWGTVWFVWDIINDGDGWACGIRQRKRLIDLPTVFNNNTNVELINVNLHKWCHCVTASTLNGPHPCYDRTIYFIRTPQESFFLCHSFYFTLSIKGNVCCHYTTVLDRDHQTGLWQHQTAWKNTHPPTHTCIFFHLFKQHH